MIQQRQFRKSHPDQHYAAAVFRYQREYACIFFQHSTFISIDDKHRIKVGKPNFPVAAAERGRRVAVSMSKSFQVGDHDFTKFSLVPFVCLVIDIPEKVSDFWYCGKDAIFQPSPPIRHATEVSAVLVSCHSPVPPVLFVYSDGGPDHRITYVSVQISLVALFLHHDLDYIRVARTAPCHSWRNPVECVMALLNLGLQCVGLMRKEMPAEYETAIKNCNSMAEIRKAKSGPLFVDAVTESLPPEPVFTVEIKGRTCTVFFCSICY